MVTRRRQRGQLVLIAAILVATAILGAVVLLNTVHSSPDVKSQTDAQSLSKAERTVEDVRHDIHEVFVATSTDVGEQQYPFARSDRVLADNVSAYAGQLAQIASTTGPTVSTVEYDATSSVNGTFVAGSIPTLSGSEFVVGGADSLPHLKVTLTEDAPVAIEFYNSSSLDYDADTPERAIELGGTQTSYDDGSTSGTCGVGPAGAETVTVTLQQGAGTVRDDTGAFCKVALDELDQYFLRINATGGDADGSFAVSGGGRGASEGGTFETVERDVVVNPAFNISYRDPGVSYTSEFRLFGEDDAASSLRSCAYAESYIKTNGGFDLDGETVACDIVGDLDVDESDIDIDLDTDFRLIGSISTDGDVDLDSSLVTGGVTTTGQDIVITDGSRVGSDIVAPPGTNIDIDGGSTVGGDVVARDGSVSIDGVTIDGDVYANDGDFSCSSSKIDGEKCPTYDPRDPDDY